MLALKYAFKPAHTVATQAYLCQHRIILLGSIIMDGPVYQGWYNSRKLPHFDGPSVTQFISFRLADSLPSDRLRQIKAELRALPLAQQGVERRRKMEYWIDRGLGCCALAHPQMAAVFLEGLRVPDGRRYRLLAWCLMPNHVHILIEAHYSLPRIVQSWKSYSGRWAIGNNVRLGLGIPAGSVWARGYWDRFIRDEKHFHTAVNYIHENPVKAGLCKAADSWRWSSAYAGPE